MRRAVLTSSTGLPAGAGVLTPKPGGEQSPSPCLLIIELLTGLQMMGLSSVHPGACSYRRDAGRLVTVSVQIKQLEVLVQIGNAV